MKILINLILLVSISLLMSCKKEEPEVTTPTITTQQSCAYNKGSFDITLDGQNYSLAPNDSTHFFIFYNYYQDSLTAFDLQGVDQNNKKMTMRFWINEPFSVGTKTYSENNGDLFDFDIDVNDYTVGGYVNEVTFNVTEANLVYEQGVNVYRLIVTSFSGVAYQYPTPSGNQIPPDTFDFTGNFCLNGAYFP